MYESALSGRGLDELQQPSSYDAAVYVRVYI